MKKTLSIAWNQLTNDNRVLNQAISLQDNGYKVTLVGYKLNPDLPSREMFKGIKIRRINIGFKYLGFWQRIPYSRNIYLAIQIPTILFIIGLRGFQFIHCHDLNTLIYGVRIKKLIGKRVKLIYDAHEHETEIANLVGNEKMLAKRQEKEWIKYCDRVITVSNSIAEDYSQLYNIKTPLVINNCPRLRTKNIQRRNHFREIFNISDDYKIFLYQGGLDYERGIEKILDVSSELREKNFIFVFLGDGPLADLVKNHKGYGDNIFLHSYVSGDIVLEYTSSADFGIVFIEDTCLSHRYCLPNKLFEYIAAGLPVLSSALVDTSQFISEYKVGISAKTNDKKGLREAILALDSMDYEDLQKNIAYARSKFNWSTQEKKLIDLYKNL